MAKPSTKPKGTGPKALEGTSRAKRFAALILESFAGLRGPQETSEAMGVTLARYYQLETKALQGMVDALEPQPRGPKADPSKAVARLEAEKKQVERQLLRYQSLHRAATRSLDLPSTSAKPGARSQAGKTVKQRRRRKTARGQTVARELLLSEDLGANKGEGASATATDGAAR